MATPFTIAAQGEFTSLLRFIQELPRRKTLVGIDSAQLAISKASVAEGPRLNGTIHATLYRLLINDV